MSEYENMMWRNSLIINNPTEFCAIVVHGTSFRAKIWRMMSSMGTS